MTLDFAAVTARWPMFLDGALMTLRLAAGATVVGFVIGTLCAIGKRGQVAWIRRACTACGMSRASAPAQVTACRR